jgi:DNA polymerase elongation subunit (family B)
MAVRKRKHRKPATTGEGYTRAWYDWKRDKVIMLARAGDRAWVERVPSKWYFTVDRGQLRKVKTRRLMSEVRDVRPDGEYARLYVPYRDRKGAIDECRRIGLVPLEADAKPVERLLADTPVKMGRPRVLYYDFESDPRLGFVTDDKGRTGPHPRSRIISVACKSSESGEYEFRMLGLPDPEMLLHDEDYEHELDVAEQELIEWLLERATAHDLLVAWNGAGFDKPLLELRCKALGIYPPWRKLNFLDMMLLLKHPYYGYGRDEEATGVKTSWKLDKLGEVVLGRGKVKDVSGAQSLDLFLNDPVKLREYNIRDVEIMQELEDKMGYIQAHTVLAHICGRFPSDRTLKSGYMNDGFVLRFGGQRKVRFSSVWYEEAKEIDEDKIPGAHVLDVVPGLHEGVHCVDFGSLYPNIIISFNISPETRVEEGIAEWRRLKKKGVLAQAPSGAWFRQDVEGIVPAICRVALDRRAEWKEKIKALEKAGKEGSTEWRVAKNYSDSWKVLANAFYGLLASKFARIYDLECAKAVTATGRELLKLIGEVAERYRIPVLAGDTDSQFIKCSRKHADQFRVKAAVAIDAWFKERGGTEGRVRLGHDGTYLRIFWTAKKRYAGLQVFPDGTEKVKVKGLELVRTDVAKAGQNLVAEALEQILCAPSFDAKKAQVMLIEWNKKVYGHELGEDVVISKAVNKPLGEYDSDLPQVAAAKAMLDAGEEVYVGMKVGYVVTGSNPTVVEPATQWDGKRYDPTYYWRSQVFPPTQRLLESVFPDVQWKAFLKVSPTYQRSMFGGVV